jgi:hypothetical protein
MRNANSRRSTASGYVPALLNLGNLYEDRDRRAIGKFAGIE